MIYKNLTLVWAAKTDHVCHGLGIGSFDNVDKLIVGLNEDGFLSVMYLGTDSVSIEKEFQVQ